MRQGYRNWLTVGLLGCYVTAGYGQVAPTPSGSVAKAALKTQQAEKANGKSAAASQANATGGKALLWEDRGTLTPLQVFWGAASRDQNPASRLPAPPFSNFEKDDDGTSPKCRRRIKMASNGR